MAAVSSILVELLMEELMVCCLFVSLLLGSVSFITMLCSNVDDANPSTRCPGSLLEQYRSVREGVGLLRRLLLVLQSLWQLEVEYRVGPMTVCKHLSGGFPFNLHLAVYLLPLVVLPLPLRLLLVRLGACPKRACNVSRQLRRQSARGDACGRLAVAKSLNRAGS